MDDVVVKDKVETHIANIIASKVHNNNMVMLGQHIIIIIHHNVKTRS